MLKIIQNGIEEEYYNYEDLFYNKLKDRQVDFNKILQTYIRYLQHLEDMNRKQLAICDIPLIEVLTDDKRNAKGRKDYIARYLYKYKRCDGMPFKEELEKIVENHNINLDDDYYINLYKKIEVGDYVKDKNSKFNMAISSIYIIHCINN